MITKMDKAIVGAIVALLVHLFTQSGIELPAEVQESLGVLIAWGLPLAIGLGGGFLVWVTPNRKPKPIVRDIVMKPKQPK